MLPELKLLSEKLMIADIPYMITGSVAMLIYTLPRTTRDIDLVVEIPPEKIPLFIQTFADGYYQDELEVKNEIRRKGMFNLIDLSSFFRIDFIVRQESEYEKHKFDRRKVIDFEGITLWIIQPEDLILSKLSWIQDIHSSKQIEDIQALLQLPQIDIAYIKEWINKLRLRTFDVFE